jgi:hypothetical protein
LAGALLRSSFGPYAEEVTSVKKAIIGPSLTPKNLRLSDCVERQERQRKYGCARCRRRFNCLAFYSFK